ncbi:ATP-binding protein [Nonomuraea sp. MCN248]|uniref:histidine kinase n=1 Tax=Nonomuraea corallina TaxID=2989783 RepID=A0ABT4SE91_9ACTN|nr:HAMP domain-containing sensor histidine kinase [Nonomuraea corallina]MDA0635517.1 ATP-binding protein [Nonomuraea corallina]
MNRPWPLRHRLLAALLGLSAAGLTVFAVAGVVLLDRSLLARADSQLAEFADRVSRRPPPVTPPPHEGGVQVPTRFDVAVYSPSGTLLEDVPTGAPDGPDVPAGLVAAPPRSPFTVPGRDGAGEWRVRVARLPDGNRAVVSMSLESNRSTVRELLVIQLAAGALVLALLAAVALWVVRLGLRPLTRMERTAEAIAAGDIDRRVPDSDPRTETGRLGTALNVMLERLARALRERERSERRLRRFVADASHELRTPLTSIRGFAELYQHGDADRDPVAERLLRRIESEAGRMGVLVEDLLLLARLDQEPALELSTVDLHVLAGDVVHAAHARDRDRPVRLTLSDRPVRVRGDEQRLHQVIANLVGNALTHTAPGTAVRVTVGHARVGPPEGAHAGAGPAPGAEAALVEVRDEGSGIDPEHLPHVFDRFYRADPNRSRAHGGTGLGLAIAAALADAHGGRIEVTSSGRGTTFRVLLPAA